MRGPPEGGPLLQPSALGLLTGFLAARAAYEAATPRTPFSGRGPRAEGRGPRAEGCRPKAEGALLVPERLNRIHPRRLARRVEAEEDADGGAEADGEEDG